MEVEVRDIVFSYSPGGTDVLRGVSFVARRGRFLGVVGPNGSGKSTLLRVVGGIAAARRGQVLYGGADIARMRRRDAARVVAAVGASESVVFPFTVEQVVLMGRSPYSGLLSGDSREDVAIACECMELTGVRHLAARRATQLSSGELQRVLLARALAQRPRVLLLDEPTAHLDVNFQLETMELATTLAHEQGITVIAVLHDLNLAGKHCDDVLMLADGRVVATGAPGEVLTEDNLLEVYGVKTIIGTRPDADRPAIFVVSGVETRERAGEGSGCRDD